MFLRTVKARGGEGVQHEYVRLVEAYREHGKNKQRIVCNLGRKDLLAAHLDALIALLRGERRTSTKSATGPVAALGAWDWGPMLVAGTLWRELGLQHVLDQEGGRGRGDGVALADRALVLVANRLCAPTSEHGLARWLETDFVCDRRGRRWLPQWRDDAERRASRRPRVRVHFRQLKQWYRTLDQLAARRAAIETELYLRLRDLFSLKVDCVFYDLTSTYFEGHGPPLLGAHGHSRDGKPRNRQVLVGLVLVDGWPLTHHVFAGNWRDAKTVPAVLDDLETRFGLRRVVFVGDRGMVTSANLARVREHKHGYVVGLQRRRREAVYRYIERATGPWLDCPVGRAARERAEVPTTQVQEVPSDEPGVRVFVARSEERLAYERAQRLTAMERVRKQLAALEQRVTTGKLTAPAKIGAAAARILTRSHGHRYYDWEYRDGRFRFFEHPVNLKREEAYEGKYVIQTEEPQLTAVEAVTIYKELSEVERAFANLKDIIEMRPIFHRTDARVQAHIFVAALAFLLHRAIEKKLKAAGLDLSSTEALQALRSVRVVDFTVAAREHKRSVTRGTDRAARILAALGITELDPPTPPAMAATIV
ncbi:MAG TPA: IS1634 family transposase [Gemmatimonadales bacterium]|jgi:transposase|nr:IS1634 family transposase [Gemmatimonadales bacterium]